MAKERLAQLILVPPVGDLGDLPRARSCGSPLFLSSCSLVFFSIVVAVTAVVVILSSAADGVVPVFNCWRGVELGLGRREQSDVEKAVEGCVGQLAPEVSLGR